MRAIIVYDLDQARAALTAARETERTVALFSPPGAAATLGAGYWAALAAMLHEEFPEASGPVVLDCADAPGHVLAALRAGVRYVVFTGAEEMRDRLAAIAAELEAALLPAPDGALDLLEARDPLAECRRFLLGQEPAGGASG